MRDKHLRFDWLQALRGIAAISVVLTHARFQLQSTPLSSVAERWLRPGESGVDLFFVLSGFIMIYTTRADQGGMVSAKAFLIRRFARIWPAYALASLLTASLASGFAGFSNPAVVGRLLKSIAFVPADYSGLYAPQTMPQGWTLNYEAYFYVVLAGCLACGRWRWAVGAAWFAATLIAAPLLFGASTLDSPFMPFVDRVYPFDYMTIVTNPMIWEFVGGAGAGLLFLSPLRLGSAMPAWVIVAVAIGVTIDRVFDPLYSHGPTQWGWSFVLLVATLGLASKDVSLPVPRVLVVLGNMSYTLYLIHLIVIAQMAILFGRLGLGAEIPSVSYLIIVVAVAVLAAGVSHRLLEHWISRQVQTVLHRVFKTKARSGVSVAKIETLVIGPKAD